MQFTLTRRPANHDIRPERDDFKPNRLESIVHRAKGRIAKICSGKSNLKRLVTSINEYGERLVEFSDANLRSELHELRQQMLVKGLDNVLVIQAFSLIRELSGRVMGMRHYDSQLMGGLILLSGKVAEMETGEGKTLTATLPAITMALAGVPVHVISVNDYLTERDAQNMKPLYKAAGFEVACVIHGLNPTERRAAYSKDITYVTNKELVFDYLRDRLTLGERLESSLVQAEYLHSREQRSKKLLLRGLHYGIVDEADSILIDEARTPLIISGVEGGNEKKQFLQEALQVAEALKEDEDYLLSRGERRLRLTNKGKNVVEEKVASLGPLWQGLVRRESTIQQALTALHLFHLDEQYLIRDGKVQIIDEFTGRVMEDRSWEQGLHQLIELKEACELTERRETLAKISYQRFFRRYFMLSGMTGTAEEVANELWSVYRLPTIKVSPNRPVQRKYLTTEIYLSEMEKYHRVVEEIKQIHKQGRPILVGTRSVAASEALSDLVSNAGLEHLVLNAKQDAEEANIISSAGKRGAITIATNMAGRGTDILLEHGVKENGGLHVIMTERHEAARIDRQLAGRCGRQGDAGSVRSLLSFEDILFSVKKKHVLVQMAQYCIKKWPGSGQRFACFVMNYIQKRVEKYHASVRKELFQVDQMQGDLLSFSGRIE